jgi:hypothetical protein
MGIKDRDWYWAKHDELTGRKRQAASWQALLQRSGARTARRAKSSGTGFPAWLAWLLFAIGLVAMLFVGLRGAFPHH